MTTEHAENWVKNPKIIHVILFVAGWIIGNGLLFSAITDSFAEYSFNKKHIMLYILIISSTWSTCIVVINYFRNRE